MTDNKMTSEWKKVVINYLPDFKNRFAKFTAIEEVKYEPMFRNSDPFFEEHFSEALKHLLREQRRICATAVNDDYYYAIMSAPIPEPIKE